ncbi:hypothetical protein DYB35_010731 [Aphanomyces astaci]|uniref:Uncharacterized protein n=1 Tax=Aphanomyces astaci TaxID=112090 RepID=A0A418CIK6_APHAT|nr:hypothetical protein DYB35_010731 [Aphanomyces astaci]
MLLSSLATMAMSAQDIDVFTRFNVLDHVDEFESAATERESSPPFIQDEWFETQKLDHTDATNPAVWAQRYFSSAQFYGGPGSPVFLYINGENVARNTTVVSTGLFLNELAKKHKALVVSLEHRYYGKSQPRPDFSNANLKFLRSDQALADIVKFQDHIIRTRNLTADSKWVAFGGSYPGMLAAWLKLLYPSRFVGAVASSAPIEAKIDFFEFSDVVSEGLRYYGKDACVSTVRAAMEEVHRLLTSPSASDAATIKTLFNPCSNFTSDDDRFVFERQIYRRFQGIAQNNDYGVVNLADVCDAFAVEGPSPVEKLSRFYNRTVASGRCTYNDFVSEYDYAKNTSLTTTGMKRQWAYQTCAEFGYGQTTANAKGAFSPLKFVTPDLVHGYMCRDAFNITNAPANVEATNKKYGGVNLNVANVVFPTGTIDPWAALGLTNATGSANPASEVVDILGTSHCRDMFARRAGDDGHITWAHQRVEAAVDGFLRAKC